MPPLTIIAWNPDILTNRQDELIQILNNHKPHILCLQETGLKTGINLTVKGYNIYRSDRQTERGGTAILVHEDIPAQQVNIPTEHLEHTTVYLHLDLTQLTVCSAYAPMGKLTAQDLRSVMNRPHQTALIGDINARHKSTGSKYTSKNGTVLFSPFSESPTLLIPPEHTHQHHCQKYPPATLDYAIINFDAATELKVLKNEDHSSDHHPIHLRFSNLQQNAIQKSPTIIDTTDFPAAIAELTTIDPATHIPDALITEAIHRFTTTLQAVSANAT